MITPNISRAASVAPVRRPDISIADLGAEISFGLDINDDRMLTGHFSAPTTGWLAIGFAHQAQLHGTRFILVARHDNGEVMREEHIAEPPNHRPVAALGALRLFKSCNLTINTRGTTAHFTLNRFVDGPLALALAPGKNAGLMLAWSYEKDFSHHSAWRQHFIISL